MLAYEPRLDRRHFLGLLACSPFLPECLAATPGSRTSTKSFSFTLIIAGKPDFTDEEADALYEAGCDDGTLVSRCGIAFIDFARESSSLENAINSAIANVRKAGLEVDKVSIDAEDFEKMC